MKIALLGYGKMGKTIEKLATQKGHTVVFTSNSTENTGDLKKAEVAIEFSIPEKAVSNIIACLENKIPIVSGTTGWLEQYKEVQKKCESCNGSFIYASNFSIGVNLFFNLNEHLAQLMKPWKEYTATVEETHHIQKLDAPSGTAISIAEGILKHSEKTKWVLNEENSDAIKISAKRIPDVKGTHIIDYVSDIDTITIKHEAHTREGFAMGAILAAEWLIDKKGIYTMKDVLSIA